MGEEELPASGLSATPSRREMTDELKLLLGGLGRLDPDQRRLILLAYFDGHSREQLATKLGVSVSTIKASLRQSLAELRSTLRS